MKMIKSNKVLLNFNILKNSFNSMRIYKMNTLCKIIYFCMSFILQLYLWKSINLNPYSSNMSFNKMIIYIFMSCCITVFVNFESSVIPKIGNIVVTGNIAMYLIRPIKIKQQLLLEYIGTIFYRLLFNLCPLIFISAFLFRISFRINIITLLLLILSLVFALYLYFLISYTVGLLSFWYTSIGNMNILIDSLISLFSGSLIPFYILNNKIYAIFNILPFHLIYFSPISIIIEKLSFKESLAIILDQIFWIIIFEIVSLVVYVKGIKKLNVQGG